MTEHSGIARALEVLGDKIVETEDFLLDVENQLSNANRELESLREQNKELTEQLEQARTAEAAASSYALQLERLLEECRKAYTELQELQEGIPEPKEGGADNCKKS